MQAKLHCSNHRPFWQRNLVDKSFGTEISFPKVLEPKFRFQKFWNRNFGSKTFVNQISDPKVLETKFGMLNDLGCKIIDQMKWVLDRLAQPVEYPTVDTTLADLFTGHGVTVTRNTSSVGRSESATPTRSRASGQSSTTLQADSLSDVSSAGTHRSYGPFGRAYTGPTGSTPGPRGTLGPQTSTNPFREQLYSNIGKRFYT